MSCLDYLGLVLHGNNQYSFSSEAPYAMSEDNVNRDFQTARIFYHVVIRRRQKKDSLIALVAPAVLNFSLVITKKSFNNLL